MNAVGEVHLFVLWENARVAEKRIMADLRSRFTVLAAVPARWPRGMSPADAFKRFYGTFLSDPEGKARRAGGGEFLVVVVLDRNPKYEMVNTARGIEMVDVNIFNLKYTYREWVGGQHRVHGTNSTEEARRDVMLLTGRPLAEWIDGTATGKPMNVLPGQTGWKSMEEMFAFMGETFPYAVLRNGEGLPDSFDPTHDDVDLLVAGLSDCVGLLGARKAGGGALYFVNVGGKDVKLDIRSIGDGYFDEGWQRRMLATRVKNPRGVYVLSAENHFHALVYHAVFQKREIASDYPAKAAAAARAAGVSGRGFDDWTAALGQFMAEHGYGFARPNDRTVSINLPLSRWREKAVEAAGLFGLSDVVLFDVLGRALGARRSLTDVVLSAEMGGVPCRIEYGDSLGGLDGGEYAAAAAFFATAPEYATEPLCWHVGRRGAYMVWRRECGQSLAGRLRYGPDITDAEADRIAADALAIAEALDKAGIVHRDIRPENLFLTDAGGLKLVGFRFAVMRDKHSKEATPLRKNALKLLSSLGGDCALSPGRWNDAWSLARCLDMLPQTDAVAEAGRQLKKAASRGKGTLYVRLPAKLRLKMFFCWIRLWVGGMFNSRAAEKNRVRREFARTAFLASRQGNGMRKERSTK